MQRQHEGLSLGQYARPPSRRLSRPPICAKPASRPRKMRLSRELAKTNNWLNRREKCGLITEKSIITVFNTRKLFANPCRRSYVFFMLVYKAHLLSLHCMITKRTHDLP